MHPASALRSTNTTVLRRTLATAFVAGIAFLVGCETSEAMCDCAAPASELPTGWENAQSVELTVSDCQSAITDATPATVTVIASEAGAVTIQEQRATFRCEQPVVGYARVTGSAVDLLVQPKELYPSTVAKCDCRYDVTAKLSVSSGTYQVTVYNRTDGYGAEPKLSTVGGAIVEVK